MALLVEAHNIVSPGVVNKVLTVGVTVDGSGQAITAGSKGFRRLQGGAVIIGWAVTASGAGNVVFDIRRSTTAGFPPPDGTYSIVGATPPNLTAQQINVVPVVAGLTDWTTGLAAGDCLEFLITGPPTVTRATLEVYLLQ